MSLGSGEPFMPHLLALKVPLQWRCMSQIPVPFNHTGEQRTWDLEDAAWAVRVTDVERVRSVVYDDAAVLLSEGHQLGQLLTGSGRPRGVVGGAEENQVRLPHLLVRAKSMCRDNKISPLWGYWGSRRISGLLDLLVNVTVIQTTSPLKQVIEEKVVAAAPVGLLGEQKNVRSAFCTCLGEADQ